MPFRTSPWAILAVPSLKASRTHSRSPGLKGRFPENFRFNHFRGSRPAERILLLFLSLVPVLLLPSGISARETEQTSPKSLTINAMEFYGLGRLTEDYIRPYLTFVSGREYTPRELEKAIEISIARAESDPVIDFLIIDSYENGDGTVDIVIEVLEQSFNWTFYGNKLYAQAGRYNLLGPGSLVNLAMGYNLQRIQARIPPSGKIPLGISGQLEHKLLNEFSPSEFQSRTGASLDSFLRITPFLSLYLTTGFRVYHEWNPGITNPTDMEFSIGTRILANYQYLQRISPVALYSDAGYRYIALGRGQGTHILDAFALLDIRITKSFHITAEGMIAGQTGSETVEKLSSGVPGDETSDIRVWRASLKMPLKIFSTDSELPMTFGIMPQAHAGLSASSFTLDPPSAAVGGSIFMDLGFPVGIRISPEFYYQIFQSGFAFRFKVEFQG